MIPIHELINKIRWDPNENPDDYVLVYDDDGEKEIKYADMQPEGRFIKIENKEIPMHKIRRVRKKGEIVWQRNTGN